MRSLCLTLLLLASFTTTSSARNSLRRSTHNTSNITVVNVATGDTVSCGRLDIIFLITSHHVPEDPRFENMFGYSNLADFNYAPIDIAFDEGTVSNTTTFCPNDYQTGMRGTHGEAVTPQRAQTMGVAEEQPTVVRNELSLVVKANPSSSGTAQTIVFKVPESERATLRVYDVSGRIVTTLLDRVVEPGEHSVAWQGLHDTGGAVASGVYFVELTVGRERARAKLVVSR
jgi:hypothetical protein